MLNNLIIIYKNVNEGIKEFDNKSNTRSAKNQDRKN